MKNRRFYLYAILALLIGLLLAACSGSPGTNKVELTIDMQDFAFDPAYAVLHVGDEVVITLTNSGEEPHEIMFGRDVNYMDDSSPNGYLVDLFEFVGVEPIVMGGMEEEDHGDEHGEDTHEDEEGHGDEHEGEESHGDEHGDDHSEDTHEGEEGHGDDHEEGHAHSGFMVFLAAGSETATITFTVTPEMVGTWEMGCFEADGGHYIEGMVGTLVIEE